MKNLPSLRMAAAKFIKTNNMRNELLVVESNGQPEHFYLYQNIQGQGGYPKCTPLKIFWLQHPPTSIFELQLRNPLFTLISNMYKTTGLFRP